MSFAFSLGWAWSHLLPVHNVNRPHPVPNSSEDAGSKSSLLPSDLCDTVPCNISAGCSWTDLGHDSYCFALVFLS